MRVVFLLVLGKVKDNTMARFFKQKKTFSFVHPEDDQKKLIDNSYDLVAMFDVSEPNNRDEVLFELQFMEKIEHILCSSTNETDILLSESEFPVEEKMFAKCMSKFFNLEQSKMAMDEMLSEVCLGPASREYFASQISSFTQKVVEKVRGEGEGKLVISAHMEVVTTLYKDETIEEAISDLD